MHAVTLLLILACVDLMHLEVVLPPIPFTLDITFLVFLRLVCASVLVSICAPARLVLPPLIAPVSKAENGYRQTRAAPDAA